MGTAPGDDAPPDAVGARFDDVSTGRALVFDVPPRKVLMACNVDEVTAVLAEVEASTRDGAWAYGALGYEAAGGLDPTLITRTPAPDSPPLAWFAVVEPPRAERSIPPVGGIRGYWSAPWRLQRSAAEHAAAVRDVQTDITAGEYYQANLTERLHGRVLGNHLDFYRDLVHAQGGAYNAYLDLGSHVIVSASPELFFEWSGSRLRCRPMKGTAPRGGDAADDERNRSQLRRSSKDIAENVMIVDLLRNDLGRIARTGSVQVTSLLDVERYGSVWQLTSQIEAVARPDLRLADALAALFPCGSVTGAPKVAAMRAISRLEAAPRDFYCGAIGWVAPPTEPVRARFGVAIRTVTVRRSDGVATYGAGGGITIGSRPDAEYQELLDKTTVLERAAAGDEPLELLETFGYDPGAGFSHLDRHLRRLIGSARAFGINLDETALRVDLHAVAAAHDRPLRVAVRLGIDGAFRVLVADAPSSTNGPVRVAIDDQPVDPDLLWLRHKTNRRQVYESARGRHPSADDVVLVNTRGEITESTIANVAVKVDGQWLTPPLSSGCLPGIGREVALDTRGMVEAVITPTMLRTADEIALVNSLRGWRAAGLC